MENTNQKLSTPTAIIVAGFLIMIGILITKNGVVAPASKTLSEQVGVSKDKLSACIKGTDAEALSKAIDDSVNKAMSHIPRERRGTPYSIIMGSNGAATEILGAETYDNVKKTIDEVTSGKVSKSYAGEVVASEPNDHIIGNPNAEVTIIEYSDYECPFCKTIHPDLKKIVGQYNNVAWVFRDFPLSFHPKAQKTGEAAVCAGMISNGALANVLGGSDGFYTESATDAQSGFWKMSDAIFDRMPSFELSQLPDLASELGYDRKAFEDCLNGGKAAKTITDSQAEGAKAGIQATPTTVIYDMDTGKTKTIEGALPYESIKSTLDSFIKETSG